MKIADKRKVIEVLLCTSDPGHRSGTLDVSDALGMDAACQSAAYQAWSTVMYYYDRSEPAISAAYTEAAYRLIESSPTLVREWFGAR